MRKNVASQKISARVLSRLDGSAVTSGTTTVYVTVDGGTQATSGTATHKGNGEWSYSPTQAETNGNHVAYLFVNSSGASELVQVYPVSYDPTNATSLGLANLDAAVSTRSTYAGADTSGTTTLLSRLSATRAGYLDNIAAAPLSAAGTRSALGLASANLDTQLAALSNLDAAITSRLASASYVAAPSAAAVASQVRTELTTELGRIDAATSTRATPAQVNAEVLDVLTADTFAEPASVPAATSSLAAKLGWVFTLLRNKVAQTASLQTLRNDADSGSIATAAVSDADGTTTRGEWAS